MISHESAIKTIATLRAMGAVAVGFHADGGLASASFAAPVLPEVAPEKPLTKHESLLKAEREELNAARIKRQMDEELGNE